MLNAPLAPLPKYTKDRASGLVTIYIESPLTRILDFEGNTNLNSFVAQEAGKVCKLNFCQVNKRLSAQSQKSESRNCDGREIMNTYFFVLWLETIFLSIFLHIKTVN